MAKPKTARTTKPAQGLPDRDTLLRYIREAGETDKADIARVFGLKGADRRALREMLRELETSGALGKRGRRARPWRPRAGPLRAAGERRA